MFESEFIYANESNLEGAL